MTEQQLRQQFVDTAKSFVGYKESDGSHMVIIDLYNTIKPLPIGYKMTYTAYWCAAYVSAMAQKCGLTDIIYPECGCERMINLFKAKGRWQENDAYVPGIGDLVYYDWDDNGVGDNTGFADHIGIVCSVSGTTMQIIEGNLSNKVAYRTLTVNARYIRGYALPDYASKASGMAAKPVVSAKKTIAELVTEVLAGLWDNGATRTARLTAEGYDADVVQKAVNAKLKTQVVDTCQVTLPVLSNGDKSGYAKTAQRLLIAKGYDCGSHGADGEIGPDTLSALAKFKSDNKLQANKVFDANTWECLLR